MNEAARRLRDNGQFGPHWEGCEKVHDICNAIRELERLEARVAQLEKKLARKVGKP